jgi:hypothetical protein
MRRLQTRLGEIQDADVLLALIAAEKAAGNLTLATAATLTQPALARRTRLIQRYFASPPELAAFAPPN